MKLVEIEKSQSLIQFGDSRENGQPSGLIAKERNQEPDTVGLQRIEVSQALMYAFRCLVNGHRWSRMVFGFNYPGQLGQHVEMALICDHDSEFRCFHDRGNVPTFVVPVHAQSTADGYTLSTAKGNALRTAGWHYCKHHGRVFMDIPRFLFRVKDRQIEEEANKMVASFGLKSVEIRRDDTIKDAWFEDSTAMKTTFGLDDIREYMEELTGR